ncbi:hypothetical protein Tco_0018347, partial [Tanacetum coccineum]
MAPLPAADERHPWLRYQVKGYTEGIVHSYEQRLETIWSRPVNRVHVLDFKGLTPRIRQDLAVRLRMVYTREGQQVFVSHAYRRFFGIRATLLGGVRRRMAWRQFILAFGLHTEQEMAKARGQAPEKVTGVDLFYLHSMDQKTTNVPHRLAQYLFRHAEGRKSRARLSRGHFIGYLAMHFGLVSDEGLRGLQVVTRELPLIDLLELRRFNICSRFGDRWAWEIPAQAHLPPSPVPQPQTRSQRIERIEEEMRDLRHDAVGLRGVVESFTTEQSRVSIWLISCMTQLMDASGHTYQAFDNTRVGSSRMPYQRCVRPRTSDASTSAAPYTVDQPDP